MTWLYPWFTVPEIVAAADDRARLHDPPRRLPTQEQHATETSPLAQPDFASNGHPLAREPLPTLLPNPVEEAKPLRAAERTKVNMVRPHTEPLMPKIRQIDPQMWFE